MSHGHTPGAADQSDPLDPALLARPDVRGFLAARDLGGFYRVLIENGWSQYRIARAIGTQQSQVWDIINGRRVADYDVLARISACFGIPREMMGLSYGAYADEVTGTEPPEGVDEDVLRRHFEQLLAVGAAAALGTVVPGLGTLSTGLAAPSLPADLPSRIEPVDIAAIRRYTDHLSLLARTYGGQARAAVALTDWADRWLSVDASDTARRALQAALSHLHTITAWCCHDSGSIARSHYHFGRAAELAADAGDGYRVVYALRHAGMMLIHRAEPNKALKLLQLGELRLGDAPREDPRVSVLGSELAVVSAFALAKLDPGAHRGQVRTQLAKARNGWDPPGAHARACMELDTALALLHLGQLDAAESAVTTSIQTWQQGTDRREGVEADIILARLHVQTGERDGLRLAAAAIDDVAKLHTGLARELWLPSLADTLDTRPGSDYRDLARRARSVAATRA